MSLDVVQLEVGLLQNFCEVIGCPETGRAALVDPAFEVDRLLAVARERGWTVDTILITHTHPDHVAGLDEAAQATGAVVRCHPHEVATAKEQAARVEPVADGEEVAIGNGIARALYTPGHTPGCVTWYLPEPGAVITGDVLYVGRAGCGGVAFPNSDPEVMFRSLQQVIAALPEETRLYPGHDYGETPQSTLGWELQANPALRADTLESFLAYKKIRR